MILPICLSLVFLYYDRMVPVSYNSVFVHVGGGVASDPLLQAVLDPILSVTPSSSYSSLNNKKKNSFSSVSLFWNCSSNRSSSNRRKRNSMSSNLRTNNYLRHVESMKLLPSGAGQISHLNAVILGESLATEEDDFVLPNEEFATQANVQSPEQVFAEFNFLGLNGFSLNDKWTGKKVFLV